MNRSPTVGIREQKGGYPIRNADMRPETSELERFRAENARLRAMLEAHGIDFQQSLAEPMASQHNERFDSWLLELTENEMRAALRMLLDGRNQEAERTLRRRFLAWEQARVPTALRAQPPRRVSEIEARVSFHRGVREQREHEAREAEEARRKAKRSSYLASLLENEDSAWSTIDSKLQRGSGSSYDQAFRALQDLAEAYASAKRDTIFRRRLVRLMAQHGKRGAWVARLTKAGYMWEPNR